MTESYLQSRQETLQHEFALCQVMHSSLKSILDVHGVSPEESTYRGISSIPFAIGWDITISMPGSDVHFEQRDRWGNKLKEPITVELWITDRNALSVNDPLLIDDAKVCLIVTQRGIIDEYSGAHLNVEEIERLRTDISELIISNLPKKTP